MKNKKMILAVLAVILLIGVLAAMVAPRQTEATTLEKLCPGIDFDKCYQLQIYYDYVPAAGTFAGLDEIYISEEDKSFDTILSLFKDRTFIPLPEKALSSNSQYFATKENVGTFCWRIIFNFPSTHLPDGSIRAGSLLRIENYWGELAVYYMAADDLDNGLCITTNEQEEWLQDVLFACLPENNPYCNISQ